MSIAAETYGLGMARKLRVPALLQASVDHGGPERTAWLAALPDRVEELAERWVLTIGEPFEPGGDCAWVAPAADADGRDVALKIAWQHSEALHEAEGLAVLAGHSTVQVHRFEQLDGDTTAMLLERCRPGTALRERPEHEQHRVIAELLRTVWSTELPADHPFRPLSVMADDWVESAQARLAANPGRLDPGLARDGLAAFLDLARARSDDVLLLTDLHAGNVLAGARRPWLLIDPKPYVGDRHYDVTQHLLNCEASLQSDPIGLSTEVADLAGLDASRVRRWLFARCVEIGLSDHPPWPALDSVARRLSES